jgi:phosphatidate cytidylyltransferase
MPHAASPRATSRKRGNTHSKKTPNKGSIKLVKQNETCEGKAKTAQAKLSKLMTRCVSGLLMLIVFVVIVYLGHLTIAGTMITLQIFTFSELVNLRYVKAKEKNMPFFRTLQWLWFAVAMFFAHGSSWLKAPMGINKHIFDNYIEKYILSKTVIQSEMAFFELFTFGLFSIVFIMSVLSLKKDLYDYQITQFTWTLMCVVILVLQMKTLVYNIYNGIFWFIFPFLCVVANDSGAYFAGISLGGKIFKYRVAENKYQRITFLKLSPKKTWEGFIGAMFFTVLFGYYGSQYLGQIKYFGCAYNEVSQKTYETQCMNDELFRDQIKYHGTIIALFASLVAPFGGFWASAMKRACNIKDFNNLIPGHGGFMDRLDCQFVMISFVYLYYATFIAKPAFLNHDTSNDVESLYQLALSSLSPTDQCLLAQKLSSSSNIQNCMSLP